METLGLLELPRIPDMNVPVCVVKCAQNASVMACVSNMACVEMDRSIQTGDTNSEPNGPLVSILVTTPVLRDAVYKARLAFCERPSRARLPGGIPAWERPASRKRPSHGRLKWRLQDEFGTRRFPRGRVCRASHAPCRVFCLRNARSVPGTMRSC